MLKKAAGIVLLILAALMLYLGIKAEMLPPALTGAGFLVIGVVFLKKEKGGE